MVYHIKRITKRGEEYLVANLSPPVWGGIGDARFYFSKEEAKSNKLDLIDENRSSGKIRLTIEI